MLDLSNNRLCRKIPLHLEILQGFVNATKSMDCDVAEEILINMKWSEYTLSYVLPKNTIFDFSHNKILGGIPTSIGNLSRLQLLNLSKNQL